MLSRFLRELRRGRLIGRRCRRCRRVLVPPRLFCERCFRRTDSWRYVKDTGTVNTYSVSYVGADASPLAVPLVVAVVDIDGASPGMGLLHLLGNTSPKAVRVGMRFHRLPRGRGRRHRRKPPPRRCPSRFRPRRARPNSVSPRRLMRRMWRQAEWLAHRPRPPTGLRHRRPPVPRLSHRHAPRPWRGLCPRRHRHGGGCHRGMAWRKNRRRNGLSVSGN